MSKRNKRQPHGKRKKRHVPSFVRPQDFKEFNTIENMNEHHQRYRKGGGVRLIRKRTDMPIELYAMLDKLSS
jgi:hypothetical protein